MARKLDPQAHQTKRNTILDSANRLIYTKGFEAMSIQDILDDLGISKGAFFHYFSSKSDLLAALIERMMDEIMKYVQGIINNSNLNARQKLETYFGSALHWKTVRKDLMMSLLSVWYQDENAIVRQKIMASGVKRINPSLSAIIKQGNQEGVWNAPNPQEAGKVLFYILQGFSDTLAERLLNPDQIYATEWLQSVVQTYTQAVERVLGAQPNSLSLFNIEDIQEWFIPSDEPKSHQIITESSAAL